MSVIDCSWAVLNRPSRILTCWNLLGRPMDDWMVSWLNAKCFGEQGWRSGESVRLPPMYPGFDSRTRRHKWAEFVGSLLCSERFFCGYSDFPLSSKTFDWFDLRIVENWFRIVRRIWSYSHANLRLISNKLLLLLLYYYVLVLIFNSIQGVLWHHILFALANHCVRFVPFRNMC